MRTNFKVGLGLSFGAMVVFLATIGAIERTNERKLEAKVQIAEIENREKKPQTKDNTKPKNKNKK